MSNNRKVVWKLPNGNFYRWNGESTACRVVHETSSVHQATDFYGYILSGIESPTNAGEWVLYETQYVAQDNMVQDDKGKWINKDAKINPIKDSYENGTCPDCREEIPDDVVEGGACSICGHVFYEW